MKRLPPSLAKRQATFLGATEPRALPDRETFAARMLAPLVGQGRLAVSTRVAAIDQMRAPTRRREDDDDGPGQLSTRKETGLRAGEDAGTDAEGIKATGKRWAGLLEV